MDVNLGGVCQSLRFVYDFEAADRITFDAVDAPLSAVNWSTSSSVLFGTGFDS